MVSKVKTFHQGLANDLVSALEALDAGVIGLGDVKIVDIDDTYLEKGNSFSMNTGAIIIRRVVYEEIGDN